MSSLPSIKPEKGRPEVALPGQQAPHELPQTVYIILDSSAESVNLIKWVNEHHLNALGLMTYFAATLITLSSQNEVICLLNILRVLHVRDVKYWQLLEDKLDTV